MEGEGFKGLPLLTASRLVKCLRTTVEAVDARHLREAPPCRCILAKVSVAADGRRPRWYEH